MARSLKAVKSTNVDTETSDKSVAEIFTNKEFLQKMHGSFPPLTSFTWNLISNSTSRKSVNESNNSALTSKVSPEDIFCLIGIPVVGKFGAFYQGFDTRTWTQLTLKIFKPRILVNGGSCTEKQILSLTSKPYAIPSLVAAFRFELQNCLVLEYMNAYSLQDKLRFCRRFPANVVLFFMCDMLVAVSFLHSKGLIHRNITLDVFWIQANGHLKLVDYTRCVKFNALFRKRNKSWNTVDYVAPEVFSFGRCSKDVDIWALGIILYKMTAGRQPFYADTKERLVKKIKTKDVVFSEFFSGMTEDLCKQLLQKDPKQRLGHAGDTFLCISSHDYFAFVAWEQVLSGTSKAPEIPLLMSAVRQAKYNVRPLDFRDSANMPNNLKKKPLLLQEISTKSVSEMFNPVILETIHEADIAKYQHEKHSMSLHIRKPVDRFSFQKISRESLHHMRSGERSPAVIHKPPPGSRIGSPTHGAFNFKHFSSAYVMSFVFVRLQLEQIFTEALDEFEAKKKQDMSAAEALEELREGINKKIDEVKAMTQTANTLPPVTARISSEVTGRRTL